MKFKATITCSNCNKKHEVAYEKIKPGNSIICSCGTKLLFEGDDLNKVQKELNKSIDSIGKAFK